MATAPAEMHGRTALPTSSDLLEQALLWAELGYPVFPCTPNNKTPLAGSRGFHDATTNEEIITGWWQRTPDANIGLSTAGLLVLDIDDPHPRWLEDRPDHWEDLAIAPISETPRGGRHYFFRQPAGRAWRNTAGRLATGIDTRADGGYVLIPPSRIGERSYQWLPDMALDVGPADLPEPPLWLVELLDRLQSNSTAVGSTTGTATATAAPSSEPGAGNPIPSGQRNSTLTSLAGHMRRMGLSEAEIFAALVTANRDRCHPPLDDREVARIAKSIARYAPDQTTVARVEHHFDQDRDAALRSDFDLSEHAARLATADPGPFPDHLLRVPGLIGAVMDFNLATAHRRQPVLALVGALALQSVLAARKVQDARGNRTNVYLVSLASSGAGKEHARQVNRRILQEAGAVELEGPEDIASDAGLLAAIEEVPGRLFQVDEFGRFLRTIGDPKRAPHLYGAVTVLMRLYSSAGTVYLGKAYANASRTRRIEQPCCVLHATTVPEHFYASLTSESLYDGFMGRLLVFEASPGLPSRQLHAGLNTPPDFVVEMAQWWFRHPFGTGNLSFATPRPRRLEFGPLAVNVFAELAEAVDARLAGNDTLGRPLWARVEEKACRLALLYTCSETPDAEEISGAAARWGAELATYLTACQIARASNWVAENPFDERQKRVLRIVQDCGGSITRNSLCRKTRWLSGRERKEVLDNLVETGALVEHIDTTPGRPKTTYRIL